MIVLGIGGGGLVLYGAYKVGVKLAYKCKYERATPTMTVEDVPQVLFWDNGTTPKLVTVTLSVSPNDFDGEARLHWSTDLAEVYVDKGLRVKLTSGEVVDKAYWQGDLPVYVKPLGPGTINLRFALSATGQYYVGTPAEVTGQIVVQELTLAIKDEAGTGEPIPWLLAPNERKYTAVLNPPFQPGKFRWTSTGADVERTNATSKTLTVKPKQTGEGDVTLSAEFAYQNRKLTKTLAITVYRLTLKHADGTGDPKKTALVEEPGGNLDVPRQFLAVFNPANTGKDFSWSTAGSDAYTISGNKNQALVTIAPTQAKSGQTIKVSAKLTLAPKDQMGSAEHTFDTINPEIRNDGGVKLGTPLLLQRKQKLKVEPQQGTAAWEGGSALTILSSPDKLGIELVGTQEHDDEGTDNRLDVAYKRDDQTVHRHVFINIVGLSVPPVAAAVNRKGDTIAELTSKGADGVPHLWDLDPKATEATVEGAKNRSNIKIKGKKPGIASATLTCNGAMMQEAATAEGAIVFVGERIAALTVETGDETTLAEDASAEDKTAKVLLGLTTDPVVWKVGHVIAKAEGTPAKVEIDGLPKDPGAHAWTPKSNGYVKVAASQPTDHGADKDVILLLARPKGNKGPPKDPGFEVEKDAAEAAYALAGKQAKDTLNVEVHRFGCSLIKWQRKGKTNVNKDDRISFCTHRGTPQWDGKGDWTPPPGGTDSGVAGILNPGGHQHGARCFVCSGAADEHTGDSPRHVWHYLPGSQRTFDEAKSLADELRSFAGNDYTSDVDFGALKLTKKLWNYLRPKKKSNTGKWFRARKSKMLGVLVGKDPNDGDKDVWLYALSGYWEADGGWCAPLALGDQSRTITNATGPTVTYTKTANPFNTSAMEDGWGKLGRCAAPVLLDQARKNNLKDLELTEVWVDVGTTISTTNDFLHKHEIGSCEQCRRILGRMLCEIAG